MGKVFLIRYFNGLGMVDDIQSDDNQVLSNRVAELEQRYGQENVRLIFQG
tara:strand:- start:1684 stop:1833 length:150 start_codon:yes stop_codon:yes gene_type:complete